MPLSACFAWVGKKFSGLRGYIDKNEGNWLLTGSGISFASNVTTTAGYIADSAKWIGIGRIGYLISSLPTTIGTVARIREQPLEFIGQMTQNIGHGMNAFSNLLTDDPDKQETVRAIGLGIAAVSGAMWLLSTCCNKQEKPEWRTITAKVLSATAASGLAISAGSGASDGEKQIMNACFRAVYLPSNYIWLKFGWDKSKASSKGDIGQAVPTTDAEQEDQRHGVVVVSVLGDKEENAVTLVSFGGLTDARSSAAILPKEFVLEETQLARRTS